MATRIEELREHADQAAQKLKDVAELHLPQIIGFLDDVAKNPLVTGFEAAVGGLAPEALALLNGLTGVVAPVAKAVASKADAKS